MNSLSSLSLAVGQDLNMERSGANLVWESFIPIDIMIPIKIFR